jgi:FAD/FMN-containing dehydrogenase
MADQNGAVDLGVFHQAIIDQVKAAFPVFVVVDDYPQDRRPKSTPALYLEIDEMEGAGDEDPGTSQQALSLRYAARIVLPRSMDQVGRQVRMLAAAVAAFAHLNRFGQRVNPAQVIGAYPDAFEPELDQYVVWRVEWQQVGHFGTSVWLEYSQGETPGSPVYSWAPDIGLGHEPDYQPVVP